MRFSLRTLFALTLATALVPLLAAAVTFFFHEKSDSRNVMIVVWPHRPLFVLGGKNRCYGTSELHSDASTRLYIYLRRLYCSSRCSPELLLAMNEVSRGQMNQDAVVTLNKEWTKVSPGVSVNIYELQVEAAGKTAHLPFHWPTTSFFVHSMEAHSLFRPAYSSSHVICALRTVEGPYIATSMYEHYFNPYSVVSAGKFFFNTMLALSVTVLAIFLWITFRFHRQTKSPPKNSEIAPT